MSISTQILGVFTDGPGMVADVVLELGMHPRKVSANLNYLVRARKLRRRIFHTPPELEKPGHITVWLYYLPSHERIAA